MSDNPGSPKVSGNVVVMCLTVIILACLTVMLSLALAGRNDPTLFAAIVALLGAAIPGVINSMQVQEVKHQTNGNTNRLLGIVEQLSPGEPSSPGAGIEPAPPDRGQTPAQRSDERPR